MEKITVFDADASEISRFAEANKMTEAEVVQSLVDYIGKIAEGGNTMRKIKGLRKALKNYKEANKGGCFSPWYGFLMFDTADRSV